MNETILQTFAPDGIQTPIVNVKDLCYGIVGVELLIMILGLLVFNVYCFLCWNQICEREFKMFKKQFQFVYFIPVVNFSLLVFIFIYAYNAW